MKKYFTGLYTFLITLCIPIIVGAQPNPPLKIGIQNPIEADSVAEVMVKFFDILVQLGAVAVVLAIVYAGFLFVVSKGNPEELNKAKTTLYWTIIGALILLGAQVIASVIKNTISNF